jgi:hypothetical protein
VTKAWLSDGKRLHQGILINFHRSIAFKKYNYCQYTIIIDIEVERLRIDDEVQLQGTLYSSQLMTLPYKLECYITLGLIIMSGTKISAKLEYIYLPLFDRV